MVPSSSWLMIASSEDATAGRLLLRRARRPCRWRGLFRRLVLRMRAAGGLFVDAAFGQRRQLLVGGLLLVEDLLQQIGGVVVAHRLGPRDQRAVGGHLV